MRFRGPGGLTEAHGIVPNRLEAHRANSKHIGSTQLNSGFS